MPIDLAKANANKEVILNAGKGKKVDYRVKLKGKDFEVNYSGK